MHVLIALFIISAAVVIFAVITDPFSVFSIIRLPYKARFKNGKLKITDKTDKIKLRQNMLWRWFAVVKCGIHIMNTRYVNSPRSNKKSVDKIIKDIHWLRFNPKKLLLISGDHFSALFVRNLGVFYYPTLDNNFALDNKDWEHKQIVYLQTTAYALSVFNLKKELKTTVVSTGSYQATCVNFYAYPSDTLYGMLYALASLCGVETATPYDYKSKISYSLDTKAETQKLIDKYRESLIYHYDAYKKHVFDPKKMLIRPEIHMSGAKDITKRECAFYDNVIFWKTTELAMNLGLIAKNQKFLNELKKNIIKTFWYDKGGYFIEDLSSRGKSEKLYSSDWLIVLATKFLDLFDDKERKYFVRSVEHIKQNKIDQPFAIKYQNDRRANRQFLFVRLAVASYGGNSVWSFWGMEYIKVLMALSLSEKSKTAKREYLKQADSHIESYKKAMIRDGGFAEVFDQKGNMLTTRMYRSIRQTGWVVGFEQVLQIRKSIK